MSKRLIRLHRLALIAVATAIVTAGCAEIPITGPVVQVSPPPVVTGAPPVDVEPAPPVPDGNPDAILSGFLTAVASGSPTRFSVARQYLTSRAAEEWDPTQGVTIYSSDGSALIVTDHSAALKTPVIGLIDSQGYFTAVDQPDFSHNFNMVQNVYGQWRIDDPGQGIFVSQYRFQSSFRVVPLHFFNRSLDKLVVENLYMNWADATPAAAVEALLRGPSAWLSPAAVTVIPAQTRLFVSSVPVQDGVAQVSLTQAAAGLSDIQQVQLAAQLLATLQGVSDSISGLRIDVAGVPLAVRGQDEEGVVRADTISTYTAVSNPSSQDAYGLLDDGSVVRLPATSNDVTWPVLGPISVPGSDEADVPESLAVSPDGTKLALATASGLYLASTASGSPALKRFDQTGLIRPQVDNDGVWAVSNGDVPVLWLVSNSGTVDHVPLTELAGATVVAFRVSPDRARIAVIAEYEDVDLFGLMRISSTTPLAADGWRPLVVDTGRGTLDKIYDVGWASSLQLLVLASATKDASFVVYRFDVDAAMVESLGPIGDDPPIGLAVQPRTDGQTILVVTTSGMVLRYEDATRWITLVSGVTAIALPG